MNWSNVSDLEPGDVISILGVDNVFFEDVMRTGGSIAWNDQNPGNIISSDEAVGYGAYRGKHNDIFAVFPDEATGREAVRSYLAHRRDKTVFEVMKAYAPAGHGSNDPQRYAQQVADAMGVRSDTSLAALDGSQFSTFVAAIQRVEGWRPGQAYGPDDLPADVVQWLADHPNRAERTAADQPCARKGTVAEGVKNIQQRLNGLGCNPPLVVDGNFGPRTQEAVQRFQADHSLAADGIVGSRTWRQLVAS